MVIYRAMFLLLQTYLGNWKIITYASDGLFFLHAALKSLADAKASPTFFALPEEKIVSSFCVPY